MFTVSIERSSGAQKMQDTQVTKSLMNMFIYVLNN